MPPTTAQVRKFMELTQTTKENAQAYLRNNNYHLTAALDEFYTSRAGENQDGGKGGKEKVDKKNIDELLGALFDSLNPASTYELGLDGLASYCEALDVNNMNHEFFVLSDIVQAQGFGHVTRQGFVKGWKQAWEESEGQVEPNMASHRKHVRSQIGLVRSDPAVFGKVYRSTFTTGKELGQRELEMGQALTFWGMLFEPSMKSWHSTHVNWLAVWTDYLREKFGKETVDEDGETEWVYSRSVSRDLWNQTRLFAAKTMEDETLGFWSEEQAWPGLVDEFVVWCQEKGKVAPRNGDRMEVEG